jgi:chromosome segregation ATPase
MNQSIEERIRLIERRLDQLEQEAEPINVTRIQIAQSSELRQQIRQIEREQRNTNLTLDNYLEILKELSKQSDRHTEAFTKVSEILGGHTETMSTLQANVSTLQTDVRAIKATQSDQGEILREYIRRFDTIEVSIAELKTEHTKSSERITKLMVQILDRLPQSGKG